MGKGPIQNLSSGLAMILALEYIGLYVQAISLCRFDGYKLMGAIVMLGLEYKGLYVQAISLPCYDRYTLKGAIGELTILK